MYKAVFSSLRYLIDVSWVYLMTLLFQLKTTATTKQVRKKGPVNALAFICLLSMKLSVS